MKRFAFGLVVSVGWLAGCHSTPKGDDVDVNLNGVDDEIVYQASATTRSELGVSTWSVSKSADGSIKGRDAHGEVIVEFAQMAKTVDAEHSVRRFVLRRGEKTAAMTMRVETRGEEIVSLEMMENAFADTPEFDRTLELLKLDLKAARAKGDSGSGLIGNSLAPKTLQPLSVCGAHCYEQGNGGFCEQEADEVLVRPICADLVNDVKDAWSDVPLLCKTCRPPAGSGLNPLCQLSECKRAMKKIVAAESAVFDCARSPSIGCCCPENTPEPPPPTSKPACDVTAVPAIPCDCIENGVYIGC